MFRYALAAAVLFTATTAFADNIAFQQTNLVGSDPADNPQILTNTIQDAWGIALRPPGAGGHIWISNADRGTSTEYIGDVNGIPLHQDNLKDVTIDTAGFADRGFSFVTGQAYNAGSDFAGQANEFIVSAPAHDLTTTPATNLGSVTGPAKFVFVTEDGTINAWRSSTAQSMDTAPVVVDYSKTSNFFPYSANSVFTGAALTTNAVPIAQENNPAVGNRLFVTDFRNNAILTFNNQWMDITSSTHFAVPATVGDLHPFNVMDLNHHLFVTYALWNPDGDEGFEDTPGFGHLVEYNEDGTLARDFSGGNLNSPWGVAIAPTSWGTLANDILVANFGDGTVAAFNPTTGTFIDDLRDASGNVISIDGLWGLTFGNGVSLGDANALYFTAGPNAQQDGLFGKLTAVPEPATLSTSAFFTFALLLRRSGRRPSR